MTDDELNILNKVVNKLCGKFVFGYYDLEDIKQEARIMGLEAIQNYDESKGKLYTFLYTHIKNRLFTLRRDKHYRVPSKEIILDEDRHDKWLKRNAAKQSLSQPSYIEDLNYDADDDGNHFGCLWNKDMITFIQDNLPVHLLADFRKIMDGSNIPKTKFESLINTIKELLHV